MGRKCTQLTITSRERTDLLARFRQTDDLRQKERIQTILAATAGTHSLDELALKVGRARSTVQVWLDKFKDGRVESLLQRSAAPGTTSPIARRDVQSELQTGLKTGRWRSATEVSEWLKRAHGIKRARKSLYYWFNKHKQSKAKGP